MVVLPPLFTLQWGTHRPPLTTSFAGLVPVLILLMLPLHTQTTIQCHLPQPSVASPFWVTLPGSEVPDGTAHWFVGTRKPPGHVKAATSGGLLDTNLQSLYIQDKERSITLMTSYRIPHLLMTHVVAIFLERHMGYKNVVFVYRDAFLPDDVINAMGIKDLSRSYDSGDLLPTAMANFEMWTPPDYDANRDIPLTTANYIGVGGRFGWFLPAYVIEQHGFLDHWRSFLLPNSKAVHIFGRTDRELKALDHLLRDTATGDYYCAEGRCVDGIYTPPICEDTPCAVLFSSYFNESKFLIDHIHNMSLLVRVAWLGPNLTPEFLRDNWDLGGGRRSVLFFHYTPDVLIQPLNLTSVAFPSCADHIEYAGMNKSYFCMYEMHRFNKVVWEGLKKADDKLYRSLMRIYISSNSYDDLIAEYNRHTNKDLHSVACSWMTKQTKIWMNWSYGYDKPSLYFVGLFPMDKTFDHRGKFLAPGNVPAFNLAIKAINKNTTILPNHIIRPLTLNTACEPDIVMLEFIKIILHSTKDGKYSKIIGIVGPACSDTVEPLAGVSKYFNMPIISYGAEGALFSDREQYPYFFRTIPENKIFRHVYLQLFKQLDWARVSSLTEDGHQYSEYLTPLQDLLQENGVTFNMRKYPQGMKSFNMTQYLSDLKKQDFRIIIGDFYQDMARFVLCEAYHQKMTGNQDYVWFIPSWFPTNWYDVDHWNTNSSTLVDCTTEQMIEALQGHMSLSYKYFADDNQITPENEPVSQWMKRYRNQTTRLNVPETNYAGFTYDAVWTYAFALDKLFKEDDSYTSNLRSTNTTERFIYYINNTNFEGVSGHINFTSGPSRVTDIIVWQFTNRSYAEVGRFYPDANDAANGRLVLDMGRLVWPRGQVPKDGRKECIVEGIRALLSEEMTCNTAIIYICTVSFFSLSFILVLSVVFLKRRWRLKYEAKLRRMEMMWKDQCIFKKFEGWEIPRSKVVINRKLGEGQFGTVYGGECHIEHCGWVAVAVKTLKVGSTVPEKLDFLSEADMMKNFEHDNIVKLLGVCTESEPVYTIMEFMLYGDLKTYLLERRNFVNEKNRNDDDEVSNWRLTSMALDVARALAFLSEMKYVHRDVACRNCLVNAHRSVKLADFGMTRPLNEKNYYRFSRKGMLPVRWMAPESLVEGVFTTSSDIWSYGVLLYEIITFGASPFRGLSNHQVFERVKSGQTLVIPSGVTQQLEFLLKACWHPVPAKRLTAAQIARHLEASPRLISPSLEAPHASLPLEDSEELEMRYPEKSRKLSLSLNSRAMLAQGVGGVAMTTGVVGGSGRRKRSMSGNMVMTLPALTPSLSEDGMLATSNLEALNLNQVMIEEIGVRDMGEDPLLPPSQYISTRLLSLSHKDVECGNLKDGYGITTIPKDMWTNMTPV